MGGPLKRQPAFLQFDCSLPFTRLGTPLRPRVACSLNKRCAALFKCCKPLQLPDLSGALNVATHRLGLSLDSLHAMFDEIADRNDSANCPALDDGQVPDTPLSHQR